MKLSIYTLIREPKADIYRRILTYACRRCSTALLVVRSQLPLAAQGASVVQQLQPFGLNSIVASEWPGTALLGDTALVHRFTYDADVVRILLKNSCRLFQWVQPGLPEDLCLLRASRDPWLVSVAHERDGYFFLDEPEASDLFEVVPELRSMTKMDEP